MNDHHEGNSAAISFKFVKFHHFKPGTASGHAQTRCQQLIEMSEGQQKPLQRQLWNVADILLGRCVSKQAAVLAGDLLGRDV